MDEYAQEFPDYDNAVYSVESEPDANVRSMRNNRKRGCISKQAKAAQMRRWRAKHSSSRSWRKDQARKKREQRARKASEYADAQ